MASSDNDIPSDIDELIINYLDKYDNNPERALFHLTVELGYGKGTHHSPILLLTTTYTSFSLSLSLYIEHVYSHKTIENAKRLSAAVTFSDNRERLLLAGPVPVEGMLVTPHVRNTVADTIAVDTTDSLVLLTSSSEGGNQVKSPTAAAKSRYLGVSRPTSPREEQAPSTTDLGSLHVLLMGENIKVTEKDETHADDASLASIFEVAPEAPTPVYPLVIASEEAPRHGLSRAEKGSKSQLRRDWQVIYKQATDITNQIPAGYTKSINAASRPTTAPTTTTLTTSALPGSRFVQFPEEAVWNLLRAAAALPPYYNAPGENFAETVRAALGELLQVFTMYLNLV